MKKRIVTAIVALAFAIPCFLFEATTLFLLTLVTIIASYELIKMVGAAHKTPTAVGYILINLFLLNSITSNPEHIQYSLMFSVLAIQFYFLVMGGKIFPEEKVNEMSARAASWLTVGMLLVSFSMGSLMNLRVMPDGLWWFTLILATTWSADIGAYFAGKYWGKRKLFPRISPKKTWLGLIAGAVCSMATAITMQYYLLDGLSFGFMLSLAALMQLGPLGDLLISLYKRVSGLDDTGSILPGHGGILDRIDALKVNAIIASIWIYVMGVN